jgi:hypothetical protein
MQYEYLSPHGIGVFEDAVSRLNGGNRRAPVPASLVWRELQNELICHKCFDDYISLLEIYYDAPNGAEVEEEEDPQQQGDGEEDADNAVDEGGGRDSFEMEDVEDGIGEEVPDENVEEEVAAEDDTLEEAPADEGTAANAEEEDEAPVAAWSHTNTWADLHRYPLEDLQVQSWLSNRNVYGKEWPMLLIVMCIGLEIIGNSETSRFSVIFIYMFLHLH